MEVASIRCKNPGAMWGRIGKKPDTFYPLPQGPRGCKTNAPIPVKWGSRDTIYLADGLGQDNNIAIFETFEPGIAAQLDLWRTSKLYRNKTLREALTTWSGGNNVPSYLAYVKMRVPGITEDTVMDDAFWRSPMGPQFLRAQAGHEAGKTYPAPEAAWTMAQAMVFAAETRKKKKDATVVTAGAGTAAGSAAQAQQSGMPGWEIALVIVGVVAVTAGVLWLVHKFHKGV